MATQACIDSSGLTIIGKDCQAAAVMQRILNVDALICDMVSRQSAVEYEMRLYCTSPPPETPLAPVVPVEEFCLPVCQTYIPEVQYLISVNELNEDVYDALLLLEQESCAANTSLKELEARNVRCS
jgi:BarA-like signal transduction histidine kinase